MRPPPRLLALATALILLSAPTSADPIANLKAWLSTPRESRAALKTQPFATVPLTKPQATQARTLLWTDYASHLRATREKEWKDQSITAAGQTMKFKSEFFGAKPKDGWPLFISMHGGGNAPPRLNDQQWQNQARLYQPANSLYVTPRAPTNTWNLWHEPHIDALFDRVIQDAIVLHDVNPNRVYILGYSAGGDGAYQLAPRMADRWAAAAMMAGHPNDASPLGLRNIGFTIHVGERDTSYKRNQVAAEWKTLLADLQKADPKGYAHDVQIHAGKGHWMDRDDRVALDWMAKFTRNPHPDRVVWKQSPVTHDRLYWLALPKGHAKAGQLVIATRTGNQIDIEKAEGVKTVTVLLSDAMLDLDNPVRVTVNGRELFNAPASRTVKMIADTLDQRGDPDLTFDAAITVDLERNRP